MTTETKSTVDFCVPVHGSDPARVWFPVGFEGTDPTGDPSLDGDSNVFGKVHVQWATSGFAKTGWRDYPTRKSARAAAVRLVKRLKEATSDDEHNAILDRWYA